MCSRRFACTFCNNKPCSHGKQTLCSVHCWPQLKCSRCNGLVSELIHKLIYFYFHTRNDQERINDDDTDQEAMKIIVSELLKISQKSSMYEIVCENWLSMEKVFIDTPFMHRYSNAEDWRNVLNVLLEYFNSNESKLKLLLTFEEFKKETNELLVDFLKVRFDELMYLFMPDKKEFICIECKEEEMSNRITTMIEKKPKQQAVKLETNYSTKPDWLIDDLLGHVLSFLVFPRDFPTISLTCKKFYYFLHYSTNLSWISNLTLPIEKTMENRKAPACDMLYGFVENLFNTFHGFKNFSSIPRIYNPFQCYYDRILQILLIHQLMKVDNSKFECNLDTITINSFTDHGLGFISYYWLLKRNKKNPLKYLLIESEGKRKSFGMLMVLTNASRIFNSSNCEVNIRAYSNENFVELKQFNCLNSSLDLTETGLHGSPDNFYMCLPGVESQYFSNISHYQMFKIDSTSEKIIPLIRDDSMIDIVWVPIYQSNVITLLYMLKDRGINIKAIILDASYYNSCSNEELLALKKLVSLKIKVQCGQVSSANFPLVTWDLKSVIQ